MYFAVFCLAAVLTAGSCTATVHQGRRQFRRSGRQSSDSVEPSYQSMKVSYAGGNGTDPASAAKLEAFIVRVSHSTAMARSPSTCPAAPGMQQTVVSLANQINEMGIGRDRILVASHDAATGGSQVELNYISYQARTAACGDWSEDLAFTAANTTPPISAVPTSTISPPWWPTRAICWARARWTAPTRRAVRR